MSSLIFVRYCCCTNSNSIIKILLSGYNISLFIEFDRRLSYISLRVYSRIRLKEVCASSRDNNRINKPINKPIVLQKGQVTYLNYILLEKLQHYGVRNSLTWFSIYLTNKKQFILYNQTNKSTIMQIMCGVPEGSILGPLLFLLYKI